MRISDWSSDVCSSDLIANNAFRVSSERVRAGDVSPIEQQRADVLRINAQVAADSAARQAQAARANLETLLGAPVTGPLDRAWFERIDGYGPPRPVDIDGTHPLVAAEAGVPTPDGDVPVARSVRVGRKTGGEGKGCVGRVETGVRA